MAKVAPLAIAATIALTEYGSFFGVGRARAKAALE
jgi:hypothetical protein